jgi:hypothetical protein
MTGKERGLVQAANDPFPKNVRARAANRPLPGRSGLRDGGFLGYNAASSIGPRRGKKEHFMKKVFTVVLVVLALAALAHADFYIKSKAHTDAFAMMGKNQPAKDEINEQWIGNNKFANITPEMSMILDLGANKAWIINHKNKNYVETDIPLDMSKIMPPEAASMMGMLKATVSVQPTGETKTIGQWPCTKYDVSINMMMMPMKFTVWATENVPFDVNMFKDKMFASLMKGTLRLDDASIGELEKVKGYWIASEMNMEIMGSKMHTSSEVVEISQKTPGPGVYSIPAGYTKTQYMAIR